MDMDLLIENMSKNKIYIFAFVGAYYMLRRSNKKLICNNADEEEVDPNILKLIATHDLQRIAAIAYGGARDHGVLYQGVPSKVIVARNENFDLDKTIFQSVDSPLNRMILKSKLGNKLYWNETASNQIYQEFSKNLGGTPSQVLQDPTHKSIYEFMQNECNFICEHADGSFMDHLHFCRDYSMVHYKDHSPLVMLLHSICGVGTNIFPMEPSKLGMLAKLVTPNELTQICAFPSFLRLLYNLEFLKELRARKKDLHRLKSLKFHRVMDNAPAEVSAEQMWEMLNYQMMHTLDFLPAAYWGAQKNDPLFGLFIDLHQFLNEVNMLEAKVNFQLSNPNEYDEVDGLPMTLGKMIIKYAPGKIQSALAAKSMRKWSKEKGHSLDYELVFE